LTAIISPELIKERERPTFDLKLACKVAPNCEWNDVVSSSFSLDSRKLHRFIVEDLMYANPDTHEHLVLLVSAKHINFTTTWLPIYIEQNNL
jgi:hypothetical protein